MNPYEVLDISPGATADEIKAAYHQMAKQWHPDRFSGEAKVEAERRFRLLAESFNMLKDTGRREGAEPAPQGAASGAPSPASIQLDPTPERSAQSKTVDEWYADAKTAMDSKAYDRSLGLIQYAIRMNGERAEFHALFGKLLDLSNGDKRTQVRALETALRLNPRDVDSTILLAQTFQSLGMHARASRLWSVVRNLAPNHPLFTEPGKKGADKGGKAAERVVGLQEQWTVLVAEAKAAINRILKRG